MKNLICISCKNKFVGSNQQLYCSDCHKNNNNLIKDVKGGNNIILIQQQKNWNGNVEEKYKLGKMVEKNKDIKEKKEISKKEESGEKESIMKTRADNSNNLLEFLENNLKLDDVEKRKVLSRTYTVISDRMKK